MFSSVPILMYHEVPLVADSKDEVRHTNPSYILSAEKFSEQMHYLHENGYQTLTLSDLLEGRASARKRSVVITFDDGWADNYTDAFPIMKALDQKATIFVVTGFVGRQKYMSWRNLREMTDAGFSIQSHTITHRALTEISESELEEELDGSKKTIEDALETPVRFISAPHGMVSRRILKTAADAGYEGICTSNPGLKHSLDRPAVFKRINVSGTWPLAMFGRIVAGDKGALRSVRFNKGVKDLAKSVLGYKIYRSLYRFCYKIG